MIYKNLFLHQYIIFKHFLDFSVVKIIPSISPPNFFFPMVSWNPFVAQASHLHKHRVFKQKHFLGDFFQYINVPADKVFEWGYRRGNEGHNRYRVLREEIPLYGSLYYIYFVQILVLIPYTLCYLYFCA